ncbi:MAG TPA: aspartate kinase [Candidatus Acidoferrales bacterium]|nr:aspartate kinase [Candidatus Acidoferrales bacterium]
MRYAMKFGGTSVGNGDRIKKVAELVKRYYDAGNEIVVIVSAMAGITDMLQSVAESMTTEYAELNAVTEFVKQLGKRHFDAVYSAIEDEMIITDVISELEVRLEELKNVLSGIYYLGELTDRSHDYISSFGERLSAPIVSGALKSLKVQSVSLMGGEAGIITNSQHRAARPTEITDRQVRERIVPLIDVGVIPVIMGFIAYDTHNIITTLGRGGSDYTAAIVGAASEADEIWIWTDVDGIMTADPKLVKNSKTLPEISYLEAMEISFFGAKVIHPKTIEPAISRGIPVRVKNTFNPDGQGTVIVHRVENNKNIVKAVTTISDVSLVNISGAGMAGTIGIAAHVFSKLATAGVNIIMISQASSESNISILVEEAHLSSALTALHQLKSEFEGNIIREITCDEDVSAIAVVGSGMAGNPGIAGRIFRSVGKIHVSVTMISQGSSEYNVSFVVKRNAAKNVVAALHDEFKLSEIN